MVWRQVHAPSVEIRITREKDGSERDLQLPIFQRLHKDSDGPDIGRSLHQFFDWISRNEGRPGSEPSADLAGGFDTVHFSLDAHVHQNAVRFFSFNDFDGILTRTHHAADRESHPLEGHFQFESDDELVLDHQDRGPGHPLSAKSGRLEKT